MDPLYPMPDILLIQPPIRDFYLTAKRTIPYGLSAIAAALIKEGFSVDILDGLATSRARIIATPVEMYHLQKYYGKPDLSPFGLFHHYKHFGYDYDHLGAVAKHSNAHMIGISSLFTAYADEAIRLAECIKTYCHDSHIVLGGHHPTVLPESVMNSSSVDFVIRGDGEVSLPLLAKALTNGSKMKGIPGIVFRKNDGSLHINAPACLTNPDEMPLPAVHLLKHQYYRRNRKGAMVIAATRGCPMACSYCCLRKSPYRKRSVQSVMDEIQAARKLFDVGFIDFEDENLSLDRRWFLQLLTELHKRFNGCEMELRAMNGLYPPSLDEEIVYAMQRAGFKTLNLSLCSTSPSQLERFNRNDATTAFNAALSWAEKWGLDAVGYIIAGGPFQSAEESISDLLFLAQKRVLVGLSIFYPAPGSPDYKLCKTFDLLPDTFSLLRASALPLSHTTSRTESITLLRLARILNFIKLLIDRGQKIPPPVPMDETVNIKNKDRTKAGKLLLQWFLYDGQIRGLGAGGEVITHKIAPELADQFIKGLNQIRIRGVRSPTAGVRVIG
jgi:radical SAM superfamily enzyme YgiQ (UPF0313 family)